jgi:hypothetical protein
MTLYLDSCSSLCRKIKNGWIIIIIVSGSPSGSIINADQSLRRISFKRKPSKWKPVPGRCFYAVPLTIKSSIHPDWAKPNFPVCVDFFTGLHVDLIRPRIMENGPFVLKSLYPFSHTTGTYEEFFNPENYSITTIKFVINQLKNNYLIRYRYPFKKCRHSGI